MRKINTDLADYIGSYSINSLIDEIQSVDEDAEISWNSFGGSVYAGQKMIDFLNNRETKLTANVSGVAASMGAVLLPFFDNVIGSEQSDVMIHSAIGGNSTTLAATNKFLYEALAKKIDEEIFESVTGKKLKDVMLAEGENRVDVWLTGKQAKKVKLYDETYNLLNSKTASLKGKVNIKELDYELPENLKEKYGLIAKTEINKSNNNEMEIKDVTASQLKNGNPSVYNAIEKEAVSAERTRVASIMKYAKYDMDKANEMIEKGASLGIEEAEHFLEKKFANKEVEELENGSEGIVNPGKKVAEVVDNRTVEEKEKEAALNAEKEAMLLESGFELKTDK